MPENFRELNAEEILAVSGGDNPEPTCSSDGDTKSCSCPGGYKVTLDLGTGEITCEPA